MKIKKLGTFSIIVTRFGDLSPFLQFSEAFGDNFLPEIAKKYIFYKSFDVDIFGFEKWTYYCGDKFGNFLPKAGDFFFETPGHTVFNGPYHRNRNY